MGLTARAILLVEQPMNHVFVDYESVHHVDLSLIGNKAVSLTLLLGAKQKVEGAVVEKLMAHASSVHLVRLGSSGKNALDFVLAYYVGRVAITDPTGFIHILSKDTGFDPLIEHLRSRNINARRHEDSTTLTFSEPSAVKAPVVAKVPAPAVAKPKAVAKPPATPTPKPAKDLHARFLALAKKNPKNLPKTREALAHHLNTMAGKEAKANEVGKLINRLAADGVLGIDEKDAITYNL